MQVLVMQVGIVRMPVHQRRMTVAVRMSLVRRLAGRVLMLVMFIVDVAVLMLDRLVHVLMAVPLRQVQVEADRHQAARCDQRPGGRFTEKRDPQDGADEWREREIGAGPRRPEVAERRDKQDEADAVAKEADDARSNAVDAPRPPVTG